MWQKILVAVDLSPIARIAFERALNLAKVTGASLILLHVLSSDEKAAPKQWFYLVDDLILPEMRQAIVEEYQQEWQAFQTKGLAALEEMKKEAIAQNINSEILQIFGSPGPTICEQANQLAVDLITIGNRGLSGVKELFLGSVSNYVTHHPACSVLIVRHPNK